MARFTPKVRRLLSDYLTDVVLRDIDALFGDNEVALGTPQPEDGDSSARRERMRRYLSTLNLNNPADHLKLLNVYSDARDRAQEGG